MTIDKARAVLPGLRQDELNRWTARHPDFCTTFQDPEWFVTVELSPLSGQCRFFVDTDCVTIACTGKQATPENFRAALKLAGVIQ